MRFPSTRLVTAGLLALPFLILPACDDADAATRVEVAQSLIKAADDAFLAGSDKASLENIVRTLKGIKGGTKQQDATRDRMLASIQLHLATIDMAQIESMDVSIRHDLLRLRAMADSASHMSAFAAARESMGDSENATQLADRREQIRSQVEKVRLQADQLKSPVLATVESLEAASEDVLRLRRQANRLREETGLVTPIQRFSIIEQAIELERQADRIEAEMMRKELSLEIVHWPAQKMLDKSQADLEAMLAEIDAAHNSLQETTRQATQSAATARDSLHEMDARMTLLSKQVSERLSGEIRSAYDMASAILRTAKDNARKSGRGGVGPLARKEQSLLMARIELAQADLGLMEIRGLDEWIRVLDRLASNVDLGNREAWRLQADEARNKRKALAETTTQAIDASLQSGAPSSSIEMTRTHMDAAKAYLSGEEMPIASISDDESAATPSRALPGRSDSDAPPTETPSDGVSTAQGLINATLTAMKSDDLDTMVAFQDANTYFNNPEDVAEAKASSQVTLELVAINNAAKAAFGGSVQGASGMLVQSAEMMKMAASATFSNVTESGNTGSATFSIMGMDQQIPLVKVDGRWWFNGDDENGMSGAKIVGAASIVTQAKDILEKIKSGTITDQAQLDLALESVNKVIQAALAKMMGG